MSSLFNGSADLHLYNNIVSNIHPVKGQNLRLQGTRQIEKAKVYNNLFYQLGLGKAKNVGYDNSLIDVDTTVTTQYIYNKFNSSFGFTIDIDIDLDGNNRSQGGYRDIGPY